MVQKIIYCRCCGHDGFNYMLDGWHCDNCDFIEIPLELKIITEDWYAANNISPITGFPYWKDYNTMMPKRIIKNRIHEFEGMELNQLLIFLFNTWVEHYDPEFQMYKRYTKEQYMDKFSEWLEKALLSNDDPHEEYKYNTMLTERLEALNNIWEKIKLKC